MEEKNEGTLYIPERKRSNLFYWLMIIASGIFLAIGITSLTMLLYMIRDYILAIITLLTGWDTILSSIFVGLVMLFLSVLVYVLAVRGSEIAKRIDTILKLNVTNEPTEYYATDLIPEEELINEFKKRGCEIKISDNKKGITIKCPDMLITPRIKGVIEPQPITLSKIQKVAVFGVILVLWSSFVGALMFSPILYDYFWIAVSVLIGISVLLMIGSGIIKLWHSVIIVTIIVTIFTLFSPYDAISIWSMWGFVFIWIILVAIAYLLHGNKCKSKEKNKWYCDLI